MAVRMYRVLGHCPLRRRPEALLAVRPVAAIGVRVRRLGRLAAVRRHIVAGLHPADGRARAKNEEFVSG